MCGPKCLIVSGALIQLDYSRCHILFFYEASNGLFDEGLIERQE